MAPSKETYLVSAKPSKQVQVLLAWVRALERWDADALASTLDDAFEHQTLPTESLHRPVLNKSQYIEYFHVIRPLFGNDNKGTVHEVMEMREKNALTAHITFHGKSASGTAYNQERMMFVHFRPQLDRSKMLPKITRIKEFVDSQDAVKFFSAERKALQERTVTAAANGET